MERRPVDIVAQSQKLHAQIQIKTQIKNSGKMN